MALDLPGMETAEHPSLFHNGLTRAPKGAEKAEGQGAPKSTRFVCMILLILTEWNPRC